MLDVVILLASGLANGRYRVCIKDCEQLLSGEYELAVEDDSLKLYQPGQSESGVDGEWLLVEGHLPPLLPLSPVLYEVLQCILIATNYGQ